MTHAMSTVHEVTSQLPRLGADSVDDGETAQLSEIVALQDAVAAAGGDSQRAMCAVMESAVRITHADGGAVEILDGKDMVYEAACGLAQAYVGLRLDASSSLSGRAVRQKRILECCDSEVDDRVDRAACRRLGIRSMIVMPLFAQGQCVGVLKVMHAVPGAFSRRDATLLELLAGLIGNALANAAELRTQKHLEEQLRRQSAAIRFQQRVASSANGAASPDDAFLDCLALVAEHTGSFLAQVTLLDGAPRHLWHARNIGCCQPFIDVMERAGKGPRTIPVMVAQRNEALSWHAIDERGDFEASDVAAACGLRSASAFPVRVGTRVAAVIALFSTENRGFDPALSELMSAVGTQMGRVVERARAASTMAQMAHADRLATVGTLAAGVAHEINNPLSFVNHNIEFALRELALIEDVSPSTVKRIADALEDARSGTGRVRQIVSDLRTFSRADDGERAAVDVNRAVESALNMVGSEVRPRARLVRDLRPLPAVAGNDLRLAQVFLNLIVNAAQAIPEGSPESHEVTVSTRTDVAGNAVIEVRDTGVGMTSDVRAHIFEPFFTTKAQGKGTGLGLAICHGTVKALGGVIVVDSRPGQGSVFQVVLPPAPQSQPAPPKSIPPAPAVHRARLLLVDDEKLVLQAMKRILGAQFDVTVCLGGREALEVLAKDLAFDAIISDLMMPDVSGLDLHKRLSTSGDLQQRMIFLTGGAFTASATEFLESVDNPVLHKPVEAAELVDTITRFVKDRETARAA